MMRVSNRSAYKPLASMEPFTSHTGNFSGMWGGKGTTGRLPERWRSKFLAAISATGTYVVLSYDTPIAWWDATTGWVIPDVKYSPTTSRHQSIVRLAVGR